MKKLTFMLIVSMTLTGCASLTETQIEAVNQFAQTSKNFGAFPSRIMTELVEVRTLRGIYFANSRLSPESHIDVLDSVYAHKNEGYEVAQKADVTFKIIDKYAQSLLLLSSDKYEKDIEEQAKKFGVGIDSLIKIYNKIDGSEKLPEGIGGAVGKLIIMGGKQYVRAKQGKEIKKFVKQADTMISVMTKNLITFLESENINLLILAEARGLHINYLQYLNDPREKATLENDQFYLDLKTRIDEVKKLQKQVIKSAGTLRSAHRKMLDEIQQKKDLKQSVQELQDLYEEVEELRSTIHQIDNAKN